MLLGGNLHETTCALPSSAAVTLPKARGHLGRFEDDVRLVGFCDSTPGERSRIQPAVRQGEASVYRDCQSLFADMHLDLVYICLPPFAHGNEVELACKHGVHFLIEKPIALDIALAIEMARQVQASGVKCQVGFMYRYGEAAHG